MAAPVASFNIHEHGVSEKSMEQPWLLRGLRVSEQLKNEGVSFGEAFAKDPVRHTHGRAQLKVASDECIKEVGASFHKVLPQGVRVKLQEPILFAIATSHCSLVAELGAFARCMQCTCPL